MADFTTELRGLQDLVEKLGRLPAAQQSRMRDAMRDMVELVRDTARENIARMFNNPARMQDSVSTRVEGSGQTLTGTITASGLPYLAIHEYGGVIQTPEIFPVNASALHWISPAALGFSGGAKTQEGVFAMHARAHPTRIPERSYLRAALAQRRREIEAAFQGTITFGQL